MANPQAQIIISAVDKTKVAFANVKKDLQGLESSAQAVNGAFARFLPLLGAATVTAFAKNVIDSADGMNDLALRTGISIDRIAAWKLAADQSGTSVETLTGALGKASKYMVENGDALKRLGINATTAEETLFQLADIISALPADDPNRVAIAVQVLGKSAGELLPLLSQGGDELRRMVDEGSRLAEVYKELGPQADNINDTLENFKFERTVLGARTLAAVLPSLTDYIRDMNDVLSSGDGWDKFLFFTLGYTSAEINAAQATEDATEAAKKQKTQVAELEKQIRALNATLEIQKQRLEESSRATQVADFKLNVTAIKEQIKAFEDLQKAMVSAYTEAGKSAADAAQKAQDFRQSAADRRQSAEDRISDISIRNATPEDQDAVRNARILDALEKAKSARIQADYQRLLGNTKEADRLLTISEEQAQRADETAGALNDQDLAAQRIREASEALAQVDESRAQIQDKLAEEDIARQEQLRQKMSENEATINDLTARLESLNSTIKSLTESDSKIKVDVDQEAYDATKKKLEELLALKNSLTVNGATGVLDSQGNQIYRELGGGASAAYAAGGAIKGPGTGTSDSILAFGPRGPIRLSNNEHVLTAREVMLAGGHGEIYRLRRAIREGRLPKFANGGAVMRASLPSLSNPAVSSSSSLDRGTFVLSGGERVEVQATSDVFDILERTSLRVRRRRA